MARRDALDEIDLHCSERDAQSVGYLGSFDLQADVIRFCRDWEVLAGSAVYGPVLASGSVPGEMARRCTAAVSGGLQTLARTAFRLWRQTLDRVAVHRFSPSEKRAAIARSGSRLGRIEAALASSLRSRCGEHPFTALYGRSPDGLAAHLASRASCFASAFYVQDGTPCPDSVCGNRIIEPGEECDDGNLDDSDECRNDCLRP